MSDFSQQNVPKEQTREVNIETSKQSLFLYSEKHQKLRRDWLELCGLNAPTYQCLQQKALLGECGTTNSKFIGIDNDKNVIQNCQEQFTENCVWMNNQIEPLLQGKNPILENVGILNYDSMNDWKTISENGKIIMRFVDRQADKLGGFLLIVNAVCRWVSVEQAKELAIELFEHHGFKNVEKSLHPYKGTGHQWTMLHFRGMI